MRIVLLSHEFAPAINGSAKTAVSLARALRSVGHEVTVFTRTYDGPPGEEAFEGMIVRRFRPRRFRRVHLPHLPYRQGLRSAVADAFVLLHQDTWIANQAVDLWPKLKGVRVYFPIEFDPVHGKGSRSSATHRLWTRMVNRPLLKASSIVAAVTRAEAQRLREFLGAAAPVELIPLGVEKDAFAVAARPARAPESPYILQVSSRAKNKRRDLAIRVAEKLGSEIPWAFVGPGSESINGGGLHGIGVVGAEELRGWYRAARLQVTTSTVEGFGHTLLEGLAQGTPFVARPVGVAPELAEAGAGALVPGTVGADDDAVVDAFAKATRAAWDREWPRDSLRALARPYLWTRTAERVEEVVREATL